MTIKTVPLEGAYLGDLRCNANHGPSGTTMITDGRTGQCGSTDYFAASVATCVCTLIGIAAQRRELDIATMHFHVEKGMTDEPARRVGYIGITVYLPQSLGEKDRKILENAGRTCPVHRSLHPDVNAPIAYVYE